MVRAPIPRLMQSKKVMPNPNEAKGRIAKIASETVLSLRLFRKYAPETVEIQDLGRDMSRNWHISKGLSGFCSEYVESNV